MDFEHFNEEFHLSEMEPSSEFGKNLYEMIKRIQCDMPPLSIEDRLQRELAFDESRLILKKMVGYDVKLN